MSGSSFSYISTLRYDVFKLFNVITSLLKIHLEVWSILKWNY